MTSGDRNIAPREEMIKYFQTYLFRDVECFYRVFLTRLVFELEGGGNSLPLYGKVSILQPMIKSLVMDHRRNDTAVYVSGSSHADVSSALFRLKTSVLLHYSIGIHLYFSMGI